MKESLSLKSGALDAKSTLAIANHAVLCTDDRTFHIRQVHSSNSIFLLHPSQSILESKEESIASEAVSAIAQPTATLELIPSSLHGESILKQVLPIYSGHRVESEGNYSSAPVLPSCEKISKYAVLDHVPLSSGEFEALWIRLCAFEIEGQAWLPTATILAAVWNAIMSAATANCLGLEQSFRLQVVTDAVQEDGYAIPLVEAIVRRIRSNGDDLMDGCKSKQNKLY